LTWLFYSEIQSPYIIVTPGYSAQRLATKKF